MARLYVLIKKSGSKRFIGAIPAKKGATVTQLRKTVPKGLRKGFTFRIVTQAQLKKVILIQRPRRKVTRRVKRRPVRRKVKRRLVRKKRR